MRNVMQHWGGAQWVLLSLIALTVSLPPIVRVAGIRDGRRNAEWVGGYLATVMNEVVLVAILFWGGFWS